MNLFRLYFVLVVMLTGLNAQVQLLPDGNMPPPAPPIATMADPLPLPVQEPPAVLVEPQGLTAALPAPAAAVAPTVPAPAFIAPVIAEEAPALVAHSDAGDETPQQCEIKPKNYQKAKEFLKQLDAAWYSLLESVAVLVFGISGLIVAYQVGASLFGTLLLAFLPPFGGGIIRDLILGKSPINFLQSQKNISIVFIVSVVGFFVLGMSRHRSLRDAKSRELSLARSAALFDGIAMSIFTVTGTMVALQVNAKPLWIWGPLAAMLTYTGGGILRDQLIRNNSMNIIDGPLYPEIGMFWSWLLSCYIAFWQPHYAESGVMMMGCMLATFASWAMIRALKIKNIAFEK